jgi:hypothetical protein
MAACWVFRNWQSTTRGLNSVNVGYWVPANGALIEQIAYSDGVSGAAAPQYTFTRHPYVIMAATLSYPTLTPPTITHDEWPFDASVTAVGNSVQLGGTNVAFRVNFYHQLEWHIPSMPPEFSAQTNGNQTYNVDRHGYIMNGDNGLDLTIPDPGTAASVGRITVKQRMKFTHLPYDLHRGMTRELRP